MTILKIKDVVDNLKIINDIIPSINKGGCAIYAHALAKELIKLQICDEVKIVTLGRWGGEEIMINNSHTLNRLKQTNSSLSPQLCYDNGIQLCHLVVRARVNGHDFYIDSTGIYKDYYDTPWYCDIGLELNTEFGVNEVGQLASFEEGWNRQFDRRFIPKIYQMVQKMFDRVFNPQTKLNLA